MSQADDPIPEKLQREPGRSAIDRDMPCLGCGYNLRSLSLNGICPECGLPVHCSFDTDDTYSRIDFDSDNCAIASAQALERAGLPTMIKALASDVVYHRKAAAYALAQSGPAAADALPHLIAALRDRSADVRWWIAYALGTLGPLARAALPALEQIVHDPDEEVAAVAEESLRKISAPADQHEEGSAAADAPATDDDFPGPLTAHPHLAIWPSPAIPRQPAPPPPGHPHHGVMPPSRGPRLAPASQAPSWATWGAAHTPPAQSPTVPGDAPKK